MRFNSSNRPPGVAKPPAHAAPHTTRRTAHAPRPSCVPLLSPSRAMIWSRTCMVCLWNTRLTQSQKLIAKHIRTKYISNVGSGFQCEVAAKSFRMNSVKSLCGDIPEARHQDLSQRPQLQDWQCNEEPKEPASSTALGPHSVSGLFSITPLSVAVFFLGAAHHIQGFGACAIMRRRSHHVLLCSGFLGNRLPSAFRTLY